MGWVGAELGFRHKWRYVCVACDISHCGSLFISAAIVGLFCTTSSSFFVYLVVFGSIQKFLLRPSNLPFFAFEGWIAGLKFVRM